MTIEAGARAGMVAVDDKTIEYVKGRPYAPKGDDWAKAVAMWQDLHSDADAEFDRVVHIDAASIKPLELVRHERDGSVADDGQGFADGILERCCVPYVHGAHSVGGGRTR